ncbi:MAG: hypothetical protein ACI9GH_000261 [Candidatus Paceibacteria bacterium]|jgi:hypothetical protein
MNGTQFEDQNFNRSYDLDPKGMTGWLIKKGIVKNGKGAQVLLMSVLVVSVIATFFLFKSDGGYQEVNEETFIPAI